MKKRKTFDYDFLVDRYLPQYPLYLEVRRKGHRGVERLRILSTEGDSSYDDSFGVGHKQKARLADFRTNEFRISCFMSVHASNLHSRHNQLLLTAHKMRRWDEKSGMRISKVRSSKGKVLWAE
jgi:hypothetical protein